MLLVGFLSVNVPNCHLSLVLASVVQGDALNCNNRCRWGGAKGHLLKLKKNIVVLCFERHFSKKNSVIRLQSNILAPPKIFAPSKFLGWLHH